MKHINKNLFYILAGTIIEHLDSMLFALYLPILASHFFNNNNTNTLWIQGFFSFSLYFIIRPFGALLFGRIGDRYGRKVALTSSIILMSIATLGIGITPSYKYFGIFSTIIFLFLRILQGLSIGGEYSNEDWKYL